MLVEAPHRGEHQHFRATNTDLAVQMLCCANILNGGDKIALRANLLIEVFRIALRANLLI